MDQEIKDLLEQNLKLSKENNELLLKVRNFQRWSQISKLFYWFIIICIALGAFYFIKPYFESILNIYSGGVSNVNMVKNLSQQFGLESLNNILK